MHRTSLYIFLNFMLIKTLCTLIANREINTRVSLTEHDAAFITLKHTPFTLTSVRIVSFATTEKKTYVRVFFYLKCTFHVVTALSVFADQSDCLSNLGMQRGGIEGGLPMTLD